jgi:hypothetical protein
METPKAICHGTSALCQLEQNDAKLRRLGEAFWVTMHFGPWIRWHLGPCFKWLESRHESISGRTPHLAPHIGSWRLLDGLTQSSLHINRAHICSTRTWTDNEAAHIKESFQPCRSMTIRRGTVPVEANKYTFQHHLGWIPNHRSLQTTRVDGSKWPICPIFAGDALTLVKSDLLVVGCLCFLCMFPLWQFLGVDVYCTITNSFRPEENSWSTSRLLSIHMFDAKIPNVILGFDG